MGFSDLCNERLSSLASFLDDRVLECAGHVGQAGSMLSQPFDHVTLL